MTPRLRVHGSALRVIRERTGIPLTDLAAAAKISVGHMSHIEKGRKPASPAVIMRIARRLGVSLDALLHDDPVDDADGEAIA